MAEEGKYIYCIIGANTEIVDRGSWIVDRTTNHESRITNHELGPIGIGGRGDPVRTVGYHDLAAVVSDSPVMKYPISREYMMAHQLVMEKVMTDYAVLPVRFGTVAEGTAGLTPEERIQQQVLKQRYAEFKNLLGEMKNKTELGVKALWKNMDVIFQEIQRKSRAIQELKKRILSNRSSEAYGERVRIGELVKTALEAKKAEEGETIVNALKKLSVDYRINKPFGNQMVINAAFLIERSRETEFDEHVNRLTTQLDGRMDFKYVGPVPPCNFVEIEIAW